MFEQETKKMDELEIERKRLLRLLITITKLSSWNQYSFSGRDIGIEQPCGTSCCLAGHIVNMLATKTERYSIIAREMAIPTVAYTVILRLFPHAKDYKYFRKDSRSIQISLTIFSAHVGKEIFDDFAIFLETKTSPMHEAGYLPSIVVV